MTFKSRQSDGLYHFLNYRTINPPTLLKEVSDNVGLSNICHKIIVKQTLRELTKEDKSIEIKRDLSKRKREKMFRKLFYHMEDDLDWKKLTTMDIVNNPNDMLFNSIFNNNSNEDLFDTFNQESNLSLNQQYYPDTNMRDMNNVPQNFELISQFSMHIYNTSKYYYQQFEMSDDEINDKNLTDLMECTDPAGLKKSNNPETLNKSTDSKNENLKQITEDKDYTCIKCCKGRKHKIKDMAFTITNELTYYCKYHFVDNIKSYANKKALNIKMIRENANYRYCCLCSKQIKYNINDVFESKNTLGYVLCMMHYSKKNEKSSHNSNELKRKTNYNENPNIIRRCSSSYKCYSGELRTILPNDYPYKSCPSCLEKNKSYLASRREIKRKIDLGEKRCIQCPNDDAHANVKIALTITGEPSNYCVKHFSKYIKKYTNIKYLNIKSINEKSEYRRCCMCSINKEYHIDDVVEKDAPLGYVLCKLHYKKKNHINFSDSELSDKDDSEIEYYNCSKCPKNKKHEIDDMALNIVGEISGFCKKHFIKDVKAYQNKKALNRQLRIKGSNYRHCFQCHTELQYHISNIVGNYNTDSYLLCTMHHSKRNQRLKNNSLNKNNKSEKKIDSESDSEYVEKHRR